MKGERMPKTIEESTRFAASAAELFSIYTDPAKHSAALGCRVAVSDDPRAEFSAFDGQVRGKNLLVEPNEMIVQTWRGSVWEDDDPDSILILTFADTPAGGAINLTHANIPDRCRPFIDWKRAYWRPWRSYLAGRPSELAKTRRQEQP